MSLPALIGFDKETLQRSKTENYLKEYRDKYLW